MPAELQVVPPAPSRQLHVAIISDGNGRWATSRGLPRSAGHRAGAQTARAIIAASPRMGIHTLTLFALSSANWKRPQAEVAGILRILHEYLLTETQHCIDDGIRLSIIGRRDRLSATLRQAIIDSEDATARGTRLHLRLAVDYSARNAIYNAARRFYKSTELSEQSFRRRAGRGARRRARRRSADSDGRRAANLGFHAVGVGVRGILFRAQTLARFHRGRFASGDAGVCLSRANTRRTAGRRSRRNCWVR